ncbi:MAG: acylphosphatase [Candidatus Daviesbacteria bacterium]|nr:acylphosphatase [Candidatus Daviesbacteria bacterium]
MKHYNISVFGLVQGIFFRATAKEKVDQLGLSGFARNQPDGSVLIEVEGEKENLDEFVKWCHIGPSLAEVKKVIITEGKLKNFSQFTVN